MTIEQFIKIYCQSEVTYYSDKLHKTHLGEKTKSYTQNAKGQHSQKEHLLINVSYEKGGIIEFYKNVKNPELLLYIAESVGIEKQIIEKCFKELLETFPQNRPHVQKMKTIIMKYMPSEMIQAKLSIITSL